MLAGSQVPAPCCGLQACSYISLSLSLQVWKMGFKLGGFLTAGARTERSGGQPSLKSGKGLFSL